MKTFYLMLLIGPCLVAQAAEPNDSKPSTGTLPAATPAVEPPTPNQPRTPSTVPTFTPAVESPSVNLPRTLTPAVGIPAWVLPPAPSYVPAAATVAAPFKDKIVRVQASVGNRSHTFVLENVKLTSLLGTEFIVGTGVKNENDRYFGLDVYVNLRDVHTIVAMMPEQAKKFNEEQSRRPPGFNPGGPFIPSPGGPPTVPQSPYAPPPGSYPTPGYNPPAAPNPPQGQPYSPPPGYNLQSTWQNPQPPQGPYTPPPGYNQPGGYSQRQGEQGPETEQP